MDDEPCYSENYVRREIYEAYGRLKRGWSNKNPNDDSRVFKRLRNYVFHEFGIPDGGLSKKITVGELIEQIVKHAIPGNSLHERDLIQETRDFGFL